jgi:hypothetical protein
MMTWIRNIISCKRNLVCFLPGTVLVLLISCSQPRGPSVRIIVPDGFKGLIKIVEDRAGVEVDLESGEYVYRIPTNGVLKVKEASGFADWHYREANYASGKPLPVYPGAPKGKVGLFMLGTHSSGKHFLFVGTEQEKAEAMQDSFNLLR